MHENTYYGTPRRDEQNQALLLLGEQFAKGGKSLSPKDVAALVDELYIKTPKEVPVGKLASRDVKLLAAPPRPIHH